MSQNDKYASQKKYLQNKKQLRVWVDPEKYELFKSKVEQNGQSIYAVINQFIDNYCKDNAED